MPVIVDTVLAYLAGFLDGEGCIHLREKLTYSGRDPKKKMYPGYYGAIKVTQNVRAPLELFQRHFGGGIRIKGHPGRDGRKWQHFEWECSMAQSAPMLEALLPYLIVKAEEAKAAIAFFRTFHAGRRLTNAMHSYRRGLIAQVKAAKAVGRIAESRVA